MVLDQTTRAKDQQPHGQTESSQQASQTFCDLAEDERETAKNDASHEGGDEISPLDGITDRRGHHVDDQSGYSQRGEQRAAKKDMKPLVFDAYQGKCQTRYKKNDSRDPNGWRDAWL